VSVWSFREPGVGSMGERRWVDFVEAGWATRAPAVAGFNIDTTFETSPRRSAAPACVAQPVQRASTGGR
jgi:hypothetical protein